jgi:hypothetical protein
VDPALRLQPGQQELTPAQEAEARRFAEAYIQTQLSTEPVDEQEAEAFLSQAYEVVKLAPPRHIHWLDGPLQLVAVLAGDEAEVFVEDGFKERVSHCVWDDSLRESREMSYLREGVGASVLNSIDYRIRRVEERVEKSLPVHFRTNSPVYEPGWSIWCNVSTPIWERVRDGVGWNVWHAVGDSVRSPVPARIRDRAWGRTDYSLWQSIRAYDEAPTLAWMHFYDAYFAPNQAHDLASFSCLVSGYWLGRKLALVVRRPHLLSRDEAGRLHSARGKAIEYRDGWGFYAWHGVRVPEHFILAPETLTREDFLSAPNIEMRRVIQECMGGRFVSELGGVVIDSGPRGTLYELELPNDPDDLEWVAHYLQVQDASTERQYCLRVPPTIYSAERAVAWSFGLSVEDYRPAKET